MVNYYLKDKSKKVTSIVAQIFINGKRYRIPTGVSVETKFWIPGKQRCRVNSQHPEGEDKNRKLDRLEKTINANASRYENDDHVPDVRKMVIEHSGNGYAYVTDFGRDYVTRSGFSKETLKKYHTAMTKIDEWEKHEGTRLTFEQVDIHFFTRFKEWFYGLHNAKNELPYSRNYFGSIIKVVKTLCNRAHEEGITTAINHRHSRFTTDIEVTTSVYLSLMELRRIHELTVTRAMIETNFPGITFQNMMKKLRSYEIVRARFLLGAFTGLRVSDFLKLPAEMIGTDFIRTRTRKTAQDVVIPVHPVLKEVIASGCLRYSLTEQKVNDHIKEICRIAGIDDVVTFHRQHGGRKMTFTHRKYDLVTTHTARRSAATNMFLAGIPAISIMKITGHRTEASFLRYIRISQEENAELLKNHPYFT